MARPARPPCSVASAPGVARPVTAPAAAPVPPTVLYDADCGICQASVAWLRRRADVVAVAGRDWPPGERGIDAAVLARSVVVIEPPAAGGEPGVVLEGGDAVVALLGRCGAGWRVVARVAGSRPLLALTRAVYRVVARNRAWIGRVVLRGESACGVGG